MPTTTDNPTDRDLLERVERAAAGRAAEEAAIAAAAAETARAQAEAADRARREEARRQVEAALQDVDQTTRALLQCAAEWRRLSAHLLEITPELRRLLYPFTPGDRTTALPDLTSPDELTRVRADETLATAPGQRLTLADVMPKRVAQIRAAAERLLGPVGDEGAV